MLKELTYSEHTKTVILAVICRVFYVLVGISSMISIVKLEFNELD